jgi:hypothetical protein
MQLALKAELGIDLPSLRLEVHFDDLENSHYSRTFDVEFTIISETFGFDE